MNIAFPETNPTETHDVLRDALAAAQEAEALARAELKRHAGIVNLAQQAADGFREQLEAATQATGTATVADAIVLEHARRDAEAISQAADRELERATAGQEEARRGLESATQAIKRAAEAILLAEALDTAQQIQQCRDDIIRLGEQLQELVRSALDTPLNEMAGRPRLIARAFALLEKLGPDDLDRPINEIRAQAMGRLRLSRTYDERLAALIHGEVTADVAEETAA